MKTSELERSKISDIKGKRWLGVAISSLGDALSCREDAESYKLFHKVEGAQSALHEFARMQADGIPLSEDEAQISRLFHTYLRKMDDTPTGTIMYIMHDNDRGQVAWKYIIQNFNNSKYSDLGVILHNQDNFDVDDKIMLLAFRAWSAQSSSSQMGLKTKGYHILALETINEWKKES